MKFIRKITAILMALAMMAGTAAYTEETASAPESTPAPVVEQVQENTENASAETPLPTAEVPVDEPAVPVDTPVTEPAGEPSAEPTGEPVAEPTEEPVVEPTEEPVTEPTGEPVVEPTEEPVVEPTEEPVVEPTEEPVVEPTEEPAAEETVVGIAYVCLQSSDSHLNVRAEPSMDAEIIGSLCHGDQVSILAREGEWTKTTEGYVKSSYLSSSAPADQPSGEEAPAEPVSTEGLRQIIVTLVEGEANLPFYAEVGGEVIANIPAGAILHLKSVDSGYSYAVYNGVAGYVDTNKIALFNSDATEEEQEIIRSVSVSANVGSTPSHEGDQIILSAKLTGFEDVDYRLQWQCSPDGGATIIDVPGANDAQYSFIINDENAAYLWRVCVTILEVTEDAAE